MRVVRDLAELRGGRRAARAEAAIGVRRPDRVLRAATSNRPAHRGPGDGRRARHRLGARRARMLDPAPPPEGRRGGARRRSSTRRRHARARCSRPPARRPRRSATPARAPSSSSSTTDGELLLPGDEHPAPGRAPGHRVRHRPRPRRAAAARRRRGPLDRGTAPARGHAIEVRLYAEDPAADWRPQSGTLHRFEIPERAAEFTVPDRPASGSTPGSADGSVVGVHYDPMLAKVIAWAPDRDRGRPDAGRRPGRGADPRRWAPTATCWSKVLRHPAFLAGEHRHGVLRPPSGRHRRPRADETAVRLSAVAAALADVADNRARATVLGSLPAAWRNVPSAAAGQDLSPRRDRVSRPLHRDPIRIGRRGPRGVALRGSRRPERVVLDAVACACASTSPATADLVDRRLGTGRGALVACPASPTRHRTPPRARCSPRCRARSCGSPSRWATGCTAGQPLLWLEAMKMEHPSPRPPTAWSPSSPSTAGQQVRGRCWPS